MFHSLNFDETDPWKKNAKKEVEKSSLLILETVSDMIIASIGIFLTADEIGEYLGDKSSRKSILFFAGFTYSADE